MLQHNASRMRAHTHLAHAAVVMLHTVCCGLPVLAWMLIAVSGLASGVTLFVGWVGEAHVLLHAHEVWLLGLSAALVSIGGALEWSARRNGRSVGFPWLFGVSALCLLANVLVVVAH